MSDSITTASRPDLRPIHRLIGRVRLLLRTSWGVTGIGLSIGMAITMIVVMTALDMLSPLTETLRAIAFGVILIPTSWVFLVGVVIPLARRLGPVETARRIEQQIPGMHSRLVSCVDLATQEQAQRSPAFFRRLVEESLDRVRNFRPVSVIDRRSVLRAIGFALVATVVFSLLWVGIPERISVALQRVMFPFADIPPYSSVAYTVFPGTTKILKGEPIQFAAGIDRGQPESLAVELLSLDRKSSLRFDLAAQEGDRAWLLERNSGTLGQGFENGFTYRIIGGGTWSREHQIDLLERPVILSTQAAVHFPEYMGIPEARTYKPQELDVSGPEGGAVEITVDAEGAVAVAEVQMVEQRIKQVPIPGRLPRVWFDGKLPDQVNQSDGWNWQSNALGKAMIHTQAPSQGVASHAFSDARTLFPVKLGERLFVEVYLDPQNPPETVMLQWQDEFGSWEHRAYWGADKIPFGQPGTAGRARLGAIPREWLGRWVMLEIPASNVGLDGKSVKGMGFTLFGGKASWAASCSVGLPMLQDVPELVVVGTHPMQRVETSNRFTGWFPLRGSGFYRVELRNELGFANQAMKEGRTEATADLPPEIALEKPGVDVTLSAPEKIPLQALVRDDYGLNEVWLAVQREGELRYTRTQRLKFYPTPNPAKVDTLIATLDVPAMKLKVGESFRYRLEVSDRRPGRDYVVSKDYSVRITTDSSAADRQFQALLNAQDPFREKLANLIAQQSKVGQRLDAVAQKYEPLQSKIQQMQMADALKNDKAPPQAKAEPTKQPLTPEQMQKLSPDEQKQLGQLRQELAEIAAEEAKNEATSKELANDLANLANQAQKTPLLAKDLADAFADAQQQFQQQAVSPIGDLVQQLRKGANPQDAPADSRKLDQQSDRIQANLESMKRQMDALANAQKNSKNDLNSALQAFKNAKDREQAKMTANELQELKDFLKGLREQLKQSENLQGQLADQTNEAPKESLPKLEGEQDRLEAQTDPQLNQAKQLLDKNRLERIKRNLNLPDEPYAREGQERMVPPTEDDTPEEKSKDANGKKPANDPNAQKPANDPNAEKPEDEDATLQPALSGERLKQDPRFAKKQRPTPKKPNDPNAKADPEAQRADLQDRQAENQQALQNAQQALQSDENAVDNLLNQLEAATQKAQANAQKSQQANGQPMPGEPMSGESGDSELSQAMEELKDLLNSRKLADAKQMAQRAKQPGQGQQANQSPTPPPPGQAPVGNLQGNRPGEITEADLSKIDLQTRAILLQLPPVVREELLQGMKEQGPEGYRRFVADYFKRLSDAQPKP
ncbi:hypothetical protein [Tuwongella immobilis]|uniref:Uncharacterized protein n=1 Tax=Tuwongella immobilis TaxID=692036 RepID=A0A6C2YMG0_9BACT|nr:hypothetical protein [Tuwongella immobilis]VIP02547.1 Uncharacterized protein OS=Candidatus Nitrospira defluvii GN=NIDE2959 PE=4 SV=1 [Tuwongella immobilis]VTS01730.1 Uncharacterized protein OS=Candidatus Nitrospira defluvii GN=NIDE2959 PE=4 SV=1 [Tuwongella immobilis]